MFSENNFLQRQGKKIDWSLTLRNKSSSDVEQTFNFVNNSSGGKAKNITQRYISQSTDSIQGIWTPEYQNTLSKQ